MDVDRLAASTLAFCMICGLRLTVRFCFRVEGIRRGFLHWKIVLHVFYVHGRPSVEGSPSERDCCLLCNTKFPLQLLEGDPFCFRVDEQHNEKLERRHGRKEGEGQPA
jgi:hypothetical protein